MDLEHSFSVPVGVDETWKILLDPERVARLLPGATVEAADGAQVSGAFKVKLGPVNLTYRGSASIVERDDLAHRAVVTAAGADARHGDGSATVTAVLKDDGDSTLVQVATTLNLTGKPAQFGHSVMADVGSKLIGQFAAALAADLGAAEPGADEPGATAPAYSTPPAADETVAATPLVNGSPPAHSELVRDIADVEPMELIKSAGPALGKKLAGPAAVALVIALLAARRRQRR